MLKKNRKGQKPFHGTIYIYIYIYYIYTHTQGLTLTPANPANAGGFQQWRVTRSLIIAYDDVFLMFLIIEFSTVILFKVNWWSTYC